MQNLSQQRLIMSMEDFLAQVAWSGVQPSFWGGEALVAQEPQTQAAEDTPEAGEAKDTPKAEAEAQDTPVEAAEEGVSGAAKADIDDDYVVAVTTAQGTWDPWLTPAQDY